MQLDSDRRRAERVRIGPVEVRLSGTCHGSLIDLSVLGALVQLPVAQTADDSVTLQVETAGAPIQIRARIVRSMPAGSQHRVAIEFEDLSMDAIVMLSRLIDQPIALSA